MITPTILLLDIKLERMKALIKKDTCTSVSIVALFTIAKTWKQPKCPSTLMEKEDNDTPWNDQGSVQSHSSAHSW